MEKIVIYGTGTRGKSIYDFLAMKNLQKYVVAFCDERASGEFLSYCDKPVLSYEKAKEIEVPFLVSILDGATRRSLIEMFMNDNSKYYESLQDLLSQDIELAREYCAHHHEFNMETYFKNAETQSGLDIFWNEKSPFRKMFDKLDTNNIIELACGRGRHVPMYEAKANNILLVDILQKNIDICKKRFGNNSKINYYKNNGFNLEEIENAKYTALFTYDSMVHFELLDINEYLIDIYRVLKKSSFALFHHSNNYKDYKSSFITSSGGRNFMSKELFAYLSYKAGFEVVEQKVINWDIPDLDCITLLKK